MMIGVTHIGTVTVQGTEDERREMLRVMGEGVTHIDTQEVERLNRVRQGVVRILESTTKERDALQARVAELEAREAEMVAAAYEAGALAVHQEWVRAYEAGEAPPRGEPDFSETASDYAALNGGALALAAQGAVTVKPLVWEESVKGRWIGTPPLKLSDLAFWVFLRGDEFGRATKNGWEYYPTLEAAKAAAQSDYERRILAATSERAKE